MAEPVSKSKLLNQLQGLQHESPRIHAFLKELINAVDLISRDISTRNLIQAALQETEDEVENLTATIHRRYIELSWDPIPGRAFEVRQGEVADTANILFVTTNSIVLLDADNFPAGSYTWFVRVVGAEEFSSVTLAEVGMVGLVEVTQIQEFTNTLYLAWNTPVSDFEVDYFELLIGQTQLARTKSNTHLHVANADLMGMLSIKAVDIAGNEGPETLVAIELSQPNNFFRIAGLIDAEFDGTKVNAMELADNAGLLLPVDTTEPFNTSDIEDTTMQAVGETFPYWAQPSASADGSYTAEFDFGQVFENVYLRILVACVDLDEDFRHTMNRAIRYRSALSDAWIVFDESGSAPVASIRYVEAVITIPFHSSLRTICQLRSIQALLSLAFIEDSGETLVVSGSGQQVNYSVDFAVAPNVVATVLTSNDYFATVSAITVDSFTLRVVDSDGNSVDGQTVEWQARGGI